MHQSSLDKMAKFLDVYLVEHVDKHLDIVDVGSRIAVEDHITYRGFFGNPSWRYRGLDVIPGLNVDIAVTDPYRWDEIPADSVDVVISGQALEHIPLFWLTAFEIGRILKPGGITMLIAPSTGYEHRYPVDCWRFYRDGMRAIAEYLEFDVLDAYTEWKRPEWADSILVMRKPVWDDDRRRRFLQRREWQHAAARGSEPRMIESLTPSDISPLSSTVGGRLEPELEALRTAALRPSWRRRGSRFARQVIRKVSRRLRSRR